jgi:hypothetical protein
MDEEKAMEVAEKSGHRVNARGTRLLHHYAGNRGRSVPGHARLGRGDSRFKSAAAGKGHIDHQEL